MKTFPKQCYALTVFCRVKKREVFRLSTGEVKKAQYNYNCQVQGFLGVALKTLFCSESSSHTHHQHHPIHRPEYLSHLNLNKRESRFHKEESCIHVLMTFGCKKMGCASEVVRFILIIIFLMLLSFQRTHILSVDAVVFSAAVSFHIHGLKNENPIKIISGQDENEEKEGLIVEKFRALLGLKSFHTRRPSSNGDSELLSPSPSPSPSVEVEAPSPSPFPLPLPHVYAHPFPKRHRSNRSPPAHRFQHEDRGRAKKILVGVLVSVSVATVICALGLIWVFKKFRNHTRKPKRTMPLCSKNRGTGGACVNSSSQAGLNSSIDLFYLNALGDDIEQHSRSVKPYSETVNTSSNHGSPNPKCAIYEKAELNQELISSEYDNASSSSTKEILSVHEDVESVKYDSESDGGGDKIITKECHSSGSESFHSIVDSHSSNVRLSNASAGSLSEILSPSPQASQSNSILKLSPLSKQNSISNTEAPQSSFSPKKKQPNVETCLQRSQTSTPPPPPPPPPLQMPLFSLHSLTTSSSKIPSKSPRSSTFHNLSSPRNSDSNSSLNQSRENDLPSSSQPYPTTIASSPRIPPPPCPPPPFKGISNNAKTPPPPPSLLPQFTPRGKDGAPLPKLKPLHWDKVRAAPDRTMVWDKLRSSSFE